MIREDRSGFWSEIAEHPEVKPHASLGYEFSISELVKSPFVTPLRSENGGFLFIRLDGLGRVYELHTLYRPEGWGREVLGASKAALTTMLGRGAQVLTTYEVEGWWRSRPPKSFGFQPAGSFVETPLGSLRTWILTQAAWDRSPARRRM